MGDRYPVPASACLRFAAIPHEITGKTRGRDEVASPFSVGLSHPLQCAGLSRRSLSLQCPFNAQSELSLIPNPGGRLRTDKKYPNVREFDSFSTGTLFACSSRPPEFSVDVCKIRETTRERTHPSYRFASGCCNAVSVASRRPTAAHSGSMGSWSF
jgi:hypothetical protein